MKMTKVPPKRAGGQGTGHLSNPAAFSAKPPKAGTVVKNSPIGHVKKSGKSHVKGK